MIVVVLIVLLWKVLDQILLLILILSLTNLIALS